MWILNLDGRMSQAEKNLKMWKVHKYLPHSDQQQEILVASQRRHLRNHLTSEGTLVWSQEERQVPLGLCQEEYPVFKK